MTTLSLALLSGPFTRLRFFLKQRNAPESMSASFLFDYRWAHVDLARAVFLTFTCACGALSSAAQTSPAPVSPVPFTPTSGSSIDSVNLTNGSLQLAIPLWSVKQRGNLSLTFSLRYESAGVTMTEGCKYPNQPVSYVYPCALAGGTAVYPVVLPGPYPPVPQSGPVILIADNISVWIATVQNVDVNGNLTGYYWQLTTPDGSNHKLARTTGYNFRATDGTGWTWNESTYIAISEDGTRFVFGQGFTSPENGSLSSPITPLGPSNIPNGSPGGPGVLQYVEDTNGNQIHINYSNGQASSYTDSMGRNIVSPNYLSSSTNSAGCTGPSAFKSSATWNVPGYGGATVPFTFCYATVPIATALVPPYGGPAYDFSGSVTELQSVVLPDGSSWTFSYLNPQSGTINYGDLTQITTPTGGSISYGWLPGHNTTSLCQPYDPLTQHFTSQLQTRTLSSGQSGSTGTWTYSIGPETVTNTSRTINTTVTDPTGASTVHSITGLGNTCSYYDTQVQAYDASHNLLKTETHTYAYQPDIDVPYAPGYLDGATELAGPPSVMDVLPLANTIQWANGATKQTTYQYSNTFTATSITNSGSYAIPYGMPSTVTMTDYGNGAPGGNLSQEVTSYYAFTNSAALANNLLKLPSSIVTTDSVSGKTTTVLYGYDGGSLASGAASGAGWNPSPLAGVTRGNLTTIQRYWDTAAAYLTTTMTYYNTGLVASLTEPQNSSISGSLTTTFAYSSAYDGAWLTARTDPQGNSSTSSYDLTSGLIAGSVDQNGIATAYAYYPNQKLEQVSRPGGDHNLASLITYTYPNATTVTKSTLLSGSTSEIDTLIYDGLGRAIQSQHLDPQGTEFVDTVYDSVGRVYTVSTPYRSKTDSTTYGLYIHTYDGLNRPIKVTNPDAASSSISYAYAGSTTQTTNESNGTTASQHLSRLDGLERLTSECEIMTFNTPAQMGGATPSSCGLEIPGTGFVTTFTQTLRGMTSSVQGIQQRTFAYDSLSRLINSTNPESGYIQYVYDSDGNLTSKIAPAPNSSLGSSNTLTTSYTYNNVHQVTSKTFAGTGSSNTPSATYSYGQVSVSGLTLKNVVGRLTSELTTLGSVVQTESIYSYDTDGRVGSHYQCVAANCPGAFQDVEYHYDGAGNVISQATGHAGYANAYDQAGHLISVTPTWTADANHPAILVSPKYEPGGGWSSASFGNGTTETFSYQPRWITGMQVSSNANANIYNYALTRAGDAQITTAADSVNGTWNYTYDDFNRLITAQEVNSSGGVINGLTWQYDRYGNRWNQNVTAGEGRGSSVTFNQNTNQASLYLTYDDAGNVQGDAFNSYIYDAENRIATVDGSTSYIYDAEGRRVGKSTSSSVVITPATGSTGSIAVGGSETTIPLGTYATGGITVTGSDGFTEVCTGKTHSSCTTVWDSGSLSVTIDGFTSSAPYGQGIADATIASGIAAGFAKAGSPVTASASGNSVTFTAVVTGAAGNYPVTVSAGGGYTITDPNATLTGGTSTGSEYDSGTMQVSITNNSVSPAQVFTTAPVQWGQGSNSGTLASALAEAINSAAGPIVTATPGGSSVSLASTGTGASSNYVISAIVTDTISGVVTPSFNLSSSGMSGGTNAVLGAPSTVGTVFVVGLGGTVIDELDNGNWARTELYANGHHIATANAAAVVFVHEDWLGTERAHTNMAGVLCQTTTSQPLGDDASTTTPNGVPSCNLTPNFFTGKPRDTESQLDDFGARYFSSQWGHWMSPDWSAAPSGIPYSTLTNPQSFNLYAYVGNDPIDGQDPDGHREVWPNMTGAASASYQFEYALMDMEAGNLIPTPTDNTTNEAAASNQNSKNTPASSSTASTTSSGSAQQNAQPNNPTLVMAPQGAIPPSVKVNGVRGREVDYGVFELNKDGSLGIQRQGHQTRLHEEFIYGSKTGASICNGGPGTCTQVGIHEDTQNVYAGKNNSYAVTRTWFIDEKPAPVWNPNSQKPVANERLYLQFDTEFRMEYPK